MIARAKAKQQLYLRRTLVLSVQYGANFSLQNEILLMLYFHFKPQLRNT
jgi:hypothetical protein